MMRGCIARLWALQAGLTGEHRHHDYPVARRVLESLL
jgi:hypothetical protein